MVRYIAAALIMAKDTSALRDLIAPLPTQTSDPILDFIRSLFSDFDFEGSQKGIAAIEKACDQDAFLSRVKSPLSKSCHYVVHQVRIQVEARVDAKTFTSAYSLDEFKKESSSLGFEVESDGKSVWQKGSIFDLRKEVIQRTAELMERTKLLDRHIKEFGEQPPSPKKE